MSVRKRRWKTRKGEERIAWVADYTDQNSARHIKTFERKKDADAFAASTSVAITKGEHVAESATVTVKEAGGLWLAGATEAGLERTTIDQYRQHLEIHIVPFIGREKLSRLSVPLIRAFQDRLQQEDRSAVMIRRVLETRTAG